MSHFASEKTASPLLGAGVVGCGGRNELVATEAEMFESVIAKVDESEWLGRAQLNGPARFEVDGYRDASGGLLVNVVKGGLEKRHCHCPGEVEDRWMALRCCFEWRESGVAEPRPVEEVRIVGSRIGRPGRGSCAPGSGSYFAEIDVVE